MSESTKVTIGGKELHVSSHEVLAILDNKISDEVKKQVLQACPQVRGPVARIQFLSETQSADSSIFTNELSKEAKTLMKSYKAELKQMTQSYDMVEAKLDLVMNDKKATELIKTMLNKE